VATIHAAGDSALSKHGTVAANALCLLLHIIPSIPRETTKLLTCTTRETALSGHCIVAVNNKQGLENVMMFH
jgi:hypothetical protein